MNRFSNFLMLFISMSTLLCCALPALLVSIGLGVVLAGLANQVPGLIWISENKLIVFVLAGFLLCINGIWLWKNRNAPCPTDSKLRDACINSRTTSKNIYLLSLIIFWIGAFFAYIAPVFL